MCHWVRPWYLLKELLFGANDAPKWSRRWCFVTDLSGSVFHSSRCVGTVEESKHEFTFSRDGIKYPRQLVSELHFRRCALVRVHRAGAENLVCELASHAGPSFVIRTTRHRGPQASVSMARLQVGTACRPRPLCVSTVPTLRCHWSGRHVQGTGVIGHCWAGHSLCHVSY